MAMNASTDRELKELDRWIARHVFGYTVRVNPRLSASDGRTYYDPNTGWLAKWNGPNKRSWSPTTDPAAAMQVLERCCRMWGTVIIYEDKDGTEWHVEAKALGIGPFATGPTLPLAICRFARALFDRKDKR